MNASPDHQLGNRTSVTGILHDEPFDAWRAREFSPQQLLQAGVAGENDDPAHDLVRNPAEFFGGGHPLVADGAPAMGSRIADGIVMVDLVRAREAAKVVVVPEVSTSLEAFAPLVPLGQPEVFREGAFERLRFPLDLFSPAGDESRFYRFALRRAAVR